MAKLKEIFVRNPFNYDMLAASAESGLKCPEPTLTKQAFAEECDINTIVERFHLTGEMPENLRLPTYDDFSNVVDFHTAMNAIAKAREAFDLVPANVRAKFQNDPGAFVDFCSDPANLDEARKLGLAPPADPDDTAPPTTPPASLLRDPEQKKGEDTPPKPPQKTDAKK